MNGYLLRASIALLPDCVTIKTITRLCNHLPTTRLCTLKPTTTMKKENIKTIINFIITVLTAIASTFCMQSCIIK